MVAGKGTAGKAIKASVSANWPTVGHTGRTPSTKLPASA